MPRGEDSGPSGLPAPSQALRLWPRSPNTSRFQRVSETTSNWRVSRYGNRSYTSTLAIATVAYGLANRSRPACSRVTRRVSTSTPCSGASGVFSKVPAARGSTGFSVRARASSKGRFTSGSSLVEPLETEVECGLDDVGRVVVVVEVPLVVHRHAEALPQVVLGGELGEIEAERA